jgi:hypothetical protein
MMMRIPLLAAAVLLANACSAPPPLANVQLSADAVANAVLDALERKDRPALEALALSDAEFRAHVWPELPAARPERNLPYAYVWGELNQKSRLALAQTLATHGGKRYSLRRVSFKGENSYPGYVVHRDTTLVVSGPGGDEQQIEVFGSMLEKDGAWKVFSYVTDD